MFRQIGPQQTYDRERKRGVSTQSPAFGVLETLYERDARTVTLDCNFYLDLDFPNEFIPMGITVVVPSSVAWDKTGDRLTDEERAELVEDLKSAFPALSARLTLEDEKHQIFFEAEPRAYRKSRPSK